MKIFLLTLCLALLAAPAFAGDTIVNLPVWPGLAPNETSTATGNPTDDSTPGSTRITNVSSPHLYIYMLPDDKLAHPAVLIFPGGGYSILSVNSEGSQVAEWLNSKGFVAAVLLYRVPNNRDGAYQDAQRSLSLLRARASEFGIDPAHLGVMGFSAGGHLAARLSTGFETRAYTPVDTFDQASCRPDFTMLIYPAYLLNGATGAITPEVQPVWNSPPTFLAQTKLDPYYDIMPYSLALQSTAIPVKTLAYEGGGHGYGLHPDSDQPVADWPKQASAWLAQQVDPPQMP